VASGGENIGWRHKRAEFVASGGENSGWRHKNAGFVAGKGEKLTGEKSARRGKVTGNLS
jgi:hypothetical protein